jgi:hypothetical protein
MFVAALDVGELRIPISTAGRVIQGQSTCLKHNAIRIVSTNNSIQK